MATRTHKYKSTLTTKYIELLKLSKELILEVNEQEEYEAFKQEIESVETIIQCPKCKTHCEMLSDYTRLCPNKKCMHISFVDKERLSEFFAIDPLESIEKKHLNTKPSNKIQQKGRKKRNK